MLDSDESLSGRIVQITLGGGMFRRLLALPAAGNVDDDDDDASSSTSYAEPRPSSHSDTRSSQQLPSTRRGRKLRHSHASLVAPSRLTLSNLTRPSHIIIEGIADTTDGLATLQALDGTKTSILRTSPGAPAVDLRRVLLKGSGVFDGGGAAAVRRAHHLAAARARLPVTASPYA